MLKEFNFEEVDQTYADDKRSHLGERLDQLQRVVQAQEIPVLILVDGWESSGKGYVINDLTRELDPRYVRVEVFEEANEVEAQHPSVWRFWQKIPSKQEIVVYDRSFYYQVFNHDPKNEQILKKRVCELSELENTLIDSGMIIIKLFLNITQETQEQRIKELEQSPRGPKLISQEDYNQRDAYTKHLNWFDQVLEQTHTDQSPWHIISSEDRKLASKTALGIVIQEIERGMERVMLSRAEDHSLSRIADQTYDRLSQYDLDETISDKEYKDRLENLQEEAARLVYECYNHDIPIVVVFEGMDAAGKGGAIKRLTRRIDPRSYKIYGINAPDPIEDQFHYLWRFQKEFPKDGDMVIFDRSWYGRVLVERVEQFTPERDWERAYGEINQMERTLTDHGTAVMKFFLYIDLDEQARRFQDRVNDPAKNYKITPEDWRNRDKAPQYLEAMNEMLERTDSPYAPWYIVATNQKKNARLQVLDHFIDHLKSALKNHKKTSKKNGKS